MSLKESVAIALGFIILLLGSFVGRDFSDKADVLDGFLMIILLVGFFIVVTYLDKQTFGDWKPNRKRQARKIMSVIRDCARAVFILTSP